MTWLCGVIGVLFRPLPHRTSKIEARIHSHFRRVLRVPWGDILVAFSLINRRAQLLCRARPVPHVDPVGPRLRWQHALRGMCFCLGRRTCFISFLDRQIYAQGCVANIVLPCPPCRFGSVPCSRGPASLRTLRSRFAAQRRTGWRPPCWQAGTPSTSVTMSLCLACTSSTCTTAAPPRWRSSRLVRRALALAVDLVTHTVSDVVSLATRTVSDVASLAAHTVSLATHTVSLVGHVRFVLPLPVYALCSQVWKIATDEETGWAMLEPTTDAGAECRRANPRPHVQNHTVDPLPCPLLGQTRVYVRLCFSLQVVLPQLVSQASLKTLGSHSVSYSFFALSGCLSLCRVRHACLELLPQLVLVSGRVDLA